MSATKPCKHSRIVVYQDEDSGKFFGECAVCEGVSSLKKTKKEARAAMLALVVERPSNQGGLREGAGRKKKLPEDAKVCTHTLFARHFRKIERYIDKHNKTAPEHKQLKGRSAGLRKIIDDLKV